MEMIMNGDRSASPKSKLLWLFLVVDSSLCFLFFFCLGQIEFINLANTQIVSLIVIAAPKHIIGYIGKRNLSSLCGRGRTMASQMYIGMSTRTSIMLLL